jgi:hypothetical protein
MNSSSVISGQEQLEDKKAYSINQNHTNGKKREENSEESNESLTTLGSYYHYSLGF